MDRQLLKEIIVEQQELWGRTDLGVPRERLDQVAHALKVPHAVLITGIRRAGKSTLLRQIRDRHFKDRAYYFTFEDERLINFTSDDFNKLYESFLELYGDRRVFFLDEIQNAPQWENFVRRLQDKGCKFFITGSNASLLSRELGAKLTGRAVSIELFPFSFREYLLFKNVEAGPGAFLETKRRAQLKRHFSTYLHYGGMPEYLRYQDLELVKRLYEDILYRDIVARHDVKDVRALRELALHYVSHVGSHFSYNRLKNTLALGSMNTVRAYADHLQDSYLLFAVGRFAYALKQQFLSPKKAYCVDNGFVEAIAFQFSKNRGHLLENTVFTHLRRLWKDLYFYQTRSGREVDFLVREGRDPKWLIQVTQSLADPAVREREVSALQEAMVELKLKQGLLLTEDEEPPGLLKDAHLEARPVYRWLIESS